MKYVAIYYTNRYFKYRETQFKDDLHRLGFDEVISYNDEWLKTTDFYEANKSILNAPTGAGYCLWKPYIILGTLSQLDYGDVVCYFDAGDDLKKNVVKTIKEYMTSNDYMFTTWGGRAKNGELTKRDCFILMGCDNEDYYNNKQLEAGAVVIRKTDENIELMKEWLGYCENEEIITRTPSVHGNELEMFNVHFYDQSVLTNLIKMKGLDTTNLLSMQIRYNHFKPKE